MPKMSFSGLKNPGTRARVIIWAGAIVLALAAIVIVALGVTSSYWFCANGCHKVQDDTITAYNHSAHSKISCMACHMPVGANAVVFLIHKAEALGELYMTITNNYELPLNGESEVSLTMKSTQCTQCHNLQTRKVTPSEGLKINHQKHSDKSIDCAICHNRTAHVEDFDLTRKDPKTGENDKHNNFMTMTGCFRCHTQDPVAASAEASASASEGASGTEAASTEGEAKMVAPGACIACHPADFDLVPDFHKAKSFFPKGHAELAKAQYAEVASATVEAEELNKEYAADFEGKTMPLGLTIPTYGEVNECKTCHKQIFCDNCHGMQVPHTEEFKNPPKLADPQGHPVISKVVPKKCVMCHGVNTQTHFCDNCHHGTKLNYKYDPAVPWTKQHPKAVQSAGMDSCFKQCHTKKFCQDCHTKTKAIPASHRDRFWVHPLVPAMTTYGKKPAQAKAKHALAAQGSIQSCEICHGAGGPNAAFCKACHKAAMPHPAEFKKFHSKTGRQNPAVCKNCHGWPEMCSNCHHTDASKTQPWKQRHGASAVKNGVTTCTENCHQKQFCLACHKATKPIPASHRLPGFTRNRSANKAIHTQLYTKNAELCTYCHGNGGSNAAFCAGCHRLSMPHKINEGDPQKFLHKSGFQKGTYKKVVCLNCHTQYFCDSCHHKGASKTTPWLKQHPNVVKKSGNADACYKCHTELFCSNCHVNLAKRGLIK